MNKTKDINFLTREAFQLVKDYQLGYLTYKEYKEKITEIMQEIKQRKGL